ncbi:hypothetical protein MRX96_027165 [Rhipicephalus microplus]
MIVFMLWQLTRPRKTASLTFTGDSIGPSRRCSRVLGGGRQVLRRWSRDWLLGRRLLRGRASLGLLVVVTPGSASASTSNDS